MHFLSIHYECFLFKAFYGNKYVLKINHIYRDVIGLHLVFDYIEGDILSHYLYNNNFNEDEIKQMNYELFENIFKYNNSNYRVFNFISIYSFIITEEKKINII